MATIGIVIVPYEWTKLDTLINIENDVKYCFQNNVNNPILFYEGDDSPGNDDKGEPKFTGSMIDKHYMANYIKGLKNAYVRSLYKYAGKGSVYKVGHLSCWDNK